MLSRSMGTICCNVCAKYRHQLFLRLAQRDTHVVNDLNTDERDRSTLIPPNHCRGCRHR